MVRRAIDMSGLTQSEVARRMGVNKSAISKMAGGQWNITVEALFKLVDACGLEIIELRVQRKKVTFP